MTRQMTMPLLILVFSAQAITVCICCEGIIYELAVVGQMWGGDQTPGGNGCFKTPPQSSGYKCLFSFSSQVLLMTC